MEYSLQISMKSWNFIPRNKPTSLGRLVQSFSQKASLQSDPRVNPYEFKLRDFSILRHPFGCLAVVYALTLLDAGAYQAERSERLRKEIWTQARNLRFQGGWEKVGEALSFTPYRGINDIEQSLMSNFSTEEWFGNFLPEVYRVIEKLIKTVSILSRDKELTKRERYRGVRRKIRRRGYNDKGFRRPVHEDHQTGPDWSLDLKEQEFQNLCDRYCLAETPKRGYFLNASGGRIPGSRSNERSILQ